MRLPNNSVITLTSNPFPLLAPDRIMHLTSAGASLSIEQDMVLGGVVWTICWETDSRKSARGYDTAGTRTTRRQTRMWWIPKFVPALTYRLWTQARIFSRQRYSKTSNPARSVFATWGSCRQVETGQLSGWRKGASHGHCPDPRSADSTTPTADSAVQTAPAPTSY